MSITSKELSPEVGHEEIQEILKLGTDLREYSQEIEKELVKVCWQKFKLLKNNKILNTFRSQTIQSLLISKNLQTLHNFIIKSARATKSWRTWNRC